MNVQLDKRYPIGVDLRQAWTVLSDVQATAACMPGAAITEQVDDTHFKGTVKSKIGPATMAFGGDIEVFGIDPARHELRMVASGADKAGSSASMDLTARLEGGDTATTCVLVGHAVVSVNGKLAQFGGRLLVPVADMMLAQFAKNFAAAAATVALPATHVEATSAATPADVPAAAPPSPVAAAPVKELNALAFGWALFKGWFGGLFGRRV